MIKNVSTSEEYSPPCRMPNGLQWYKDHLYVMDQQTDQVYVLNTEGYVIKTLKHQPKMDQELLLEVDFYGLHQMEVLLHLEKKDLLIQILVGYIN